MNDEQFREAVSAALQNHGVKWIISEIAYEIELIAVEVDRAGEAKDAEKARFLAQRLRAFNSRIRSRHD